jgi:uncharacterized OB-fold protein
MPRYDVRNDGIGPYAVFYCEVCNREYRSQPEIGATIAQDVGRKALGGLIRNVPMVGRTIANNVTGPDPRYSTNLTSQQLDKAWAQVSDRFRECPTCLQVLCLSDWDETSGYCNEDTPRRQEIAEAQAEQAGVMLKGFANALGIGGAIKEATSAMKQATTNVARCPKDGTVAAAGTKFCPECGSPMTQPATDACPSCGMATHGAKFCPECGAKVERAPAVCPQCGTEGKGAKFCPECGTKMG